MIGIVSLLRFSTSCHHQQEHGHGYRHGHGVSPEYSLTSPFRVRSEHCQRPLMVQVINIKTNFPPKKAKNVNQKIVLLDCGEITTTVLPARTTLHPKRMAMFMCYQKRFRFRLWFWFGSVWFTSAGLELCGFYFVVISVYVFEFFTHDCANTTDC